MKTVSPEDSPTIQPTPGAITRWRADLRIDPRVRWWQRLSSLVILVVLVGLLGVVAATVLGAGVGALFLFFHDALA